MTVITNHSESSEPIIQPCGCGDCPDVIPAWSKIPLHTWMNMTWVDQDQDPETMKVMIAKDLEMAKIIKEKMKGVKLDGEGGKTYYISEKEVKGDWIVGTDPSAPYQESDDENVAEALVDLIPGLEEKVLCPVCPPGAMQKPRCNPALVYIVIHLNDTHEWSRHQIADWLETLDVDLRFTEGE